MMNDIVAKFLWDFIKVISDGINQIIPYSWRLLDILTILAVTWLGIETMLGKYEFGALIEKFVTMGISIALIKNLSYFSNLVLTSLLKLSDITGGMVTETDEGLKINILENPAVIFEEAHQYILAPIAETVSEQFSTDIFSLFNPLSIDISFIILYAILVLAIYICFAVIVVQIVLNYILYHITMFFGYILLPFSIFKPLDFIGKNVWKAMLTQALTLAVIVFVATIGLGTFKLIFTQTVKMALTQLRIVNTAMLWVMLAAVLIYMFICLQAPTLVMSILSGSPTLGAGGLLSTVATIGAAVAGLAGLGAAGGGASVNTVQGAGAGAGGGGAAAAAQSAGASNQFLPRTASSASGSLNAIMQQGGSMPALPGGGQASPFLPAPSRPLLEDKSGSFAPVPSRPNNDTDKDFSYKVL
jgi:type IV secretion system protein TrbL